MTRATRFVDSAVLLQADESWLPRTFAMPKKASARIQNHFVELSDPRRRKVTYPLINIVTIAICAVICGADDFVSIAEFGRKKRKWLAQFLDLADTEPDWAGVRFLQDKTDHDPQCDALGFQYTFHDDHDTEGWGRHLWLYTEGWGDASNVVHLVQKFLKTFRPDQCWSLTYATTCSKPRIGEFGGGAVFVTADTIQWENAYDFIEDQRAAFEAKRG